MNKPSSIIQITTTTNEFFKNWLIFLRPYHNLTSKQIDLAAAFLKERYELSKVISDENILDEYVISDKTKKKVMQDCEMSLAYFQVTMGELKKHRFFIDKKINPRYIPNLSKEPSDFSLLIWFKINNGNSE